MAEALLRHIRAPRACALEGDLAIAAQILLACREFDEAVEFAAFEMTSIRETIEGFFKDPDARFDPEILSALQQVVSIRQRITITDDLSVLPTAVTKLIRTSDETVSVSELEGIASSDAVLTARLLGAANSGCFGPRTEIGILRQAILRVGIPFARKTLLGACFGRLYASGPLAVYGNTRRMLLHTPMSSRQNAATTPRSRTLRVWSTILAGS
jgi:hypothetical protein